MRLDLYDIFSIGKQGLARDGIMTWLRFFFVYTEFLKASFHDQRVLDVACGDGRFLQWARRKANYVGLDIDPHILLKAKRKHQCLGLVLADASNLPFQSEAFDIVCTSETLEHLTHQKREEAINEIARVSYNHVIVTVPTISYFDFLVTVFHNLLQKLGLVKERHKIGFKSFEHQVEFFPIPFNDLVPLSSLVSMFSENGFSTPVCHEIGFITNFAFRLLKKNALIKPVSHPWLTIVIMRLEKAFSKAHFPIGHYAILHFQKISQNRNDEESMNNP
jgi:ubiquinone/menaquinone biosynthesis C-methylase UbiE